MMTTARRSEEEEEEQTPNKKTKITQQQNQQQEDDRISQLHDDILHPILSLLTLKEACITTSLSKRWRNLFPTLPRLHFDDFSFGYSSVREHAPLDHENVNDIDCWLDSVCDILESRRAPVRTCTIRTVYFDDCGGIGDIIRYLCNDGIQELSIYNTGDHHAVPPSLYFCQTLTRIELSRFILKVTSKFTLLRRLKELNIRECIVEDGGDVQRLISGCRALERLTLQHCHRLRNLAVDADKLAVLDVTTHRQLAVSIVNAPRLETITLRFRYAQSETYPLAVDSGGSYTDESEVSRLVRLLETLGNVRNLSLEFDNRYMKTLKAEGVAIPVTLRSLLPKMKRLTLKMEANNIFMVSLVSCLLNSCPNLQDLVFGDNYYSWLAVDDYRYVEASMRDYWDQHAPSHCMTNTLTKVTLCLDFGYRWKYWIEPVKFLLSNACVLKNLVIDCHYSVRSVLEDLQMELLQVHLASPDVVVELKTTRRQMFEVV